MFGSSSSHGDHRSHSWRSSRSGKNPVGVASDQRAAGDSHRLGHARTLDRSRPRHARRSSADRHHGTVRAWRDRADHRGGNRGRTGRGRRPRRRRVHGRAGRSPHRVAARGAELDRDGHLAVPTDVTDPESVDELFSAIDDRFGRIDLLFNNAGNRCAGGATRGTLVRAVAGSRRHQPDRHVPVLAAGDRTDEAASPPGGRIINNGSISAHTPRPTRRRTPRPSTPSPASPRRSLSTGARSASPAVRSTSATPPPR